MKFLGGSYEIPYPERGTYLSLRERLALDLDEAGFDRNLDFLTLIGPILRGGVEAGRIGVTTVTSLDDSLSDFLRAYEFENK